jgi:hypothetical protein
VFALGIEECILRDLERESPETFRRLCMSFDAWVVSFGVSTVLRDIHIVDGPAAYLFLLAVTVIDAWLLFRFFAVGGRFDTSQTAVPALKTG